MGSLNIFSARLGTLVDNCKLATGKSQNAIAGELGVSVGTLSNYLSATTEPKMEFCITAANYFHVTTDYLFGLTSMPSADITIKAIGEYTGLAEDTIILLHAGCCDNHINISDTIDLLPSDVVNIIFSDINASRRLEKGERNGSVSTYIAIASYLSFVNNKNDTQNKDDAESAYLNGVFWFAFDESTIENAMLSTISNRFKELKERYLATER